MDKDYYKILDVERSASKEDIKKAYKKLAKQFHPDVNKDPEAAQRFKEISEAASILADDEKRRQYDQYGTTYDQFTGHGFDYRDFGFEFGDFNLNDIFESIFGRGDYHTRGRTSRGADLQYNLEITLEEAAFGTEKEIQIPRTVACHSCNGTGAKSSSDYAVCSVCNGAGVERQVRKTPFGIFSSTTTCSSCRGKGKIIKARCPECGGTGVLSEKTKLTVKIPAGAREGTNLRLSGKGEVGEEGGTTGDLYIVLYIKPHELFQRHGDDIFIEAPISFTIAALGGEIEVPTLEGKADLKIPPGTQSETVFRMKGKGIPHLRGFGKGDQNIKVKVIVPTKLTKKQKELLEEFEGISQKKGFFKF